MTGWPRREAPDLDQVVRRADKLADRRAYVFELFCVGLIILSCIEAC